MKTCLSCEQKLSDDIFICHNCGAKQASIEIGEEIKGKFKYKIQGFKYHKEMNPENVMPYGEYDVKIYDNGLAIGPNFHNYIKINEKEILKFEHVEMLQVQDKNKSVIGRAAAGGLLLGPAGMVIGGMSGMGKKKIEKKIQTLEIGYIDNGQEKSIILEAINDSMAKLMVMRWRKRKTSHEEIQKEKNNDTTCLIVFLLILGVAFIIYMITQF